MSGNIPPWQPYGSTQEWSKQQRQTRPMMTVYEQIGVLQKRGRQLGLNAPPHVPVREQDEPTPIAIAQRELYMNKIDMEIQRELPNGHIEYWDVQEFPYSNKM